jgi:IclR family KDG regulon transcriptional repressor
MQRFIDYERAEGEELKDTLYSKAVLKTLNILEQFNKHEEMGIKDLAQATGIPPSTVQRMVNTLVMKQYLQKGSNQKYHLGLAFFSMRSRYMDMSIKIESAKKYMEAFTQTTKETINLATLRGSSIVYLTKVESPHIVRPSFDIGKPFPVVNTSLGRSLICELPWEQVEDIYDDQEHPAVSKKELKKILEEVRENGYATEDEQFEKGLWCSSAPVRDENGQIIAAVSTSVPKARLDEGRQDKLISEIVKTAKKVSDTMAG